MTNLAATATRTPAPEWPSEELLGWVADGQAGPGGAPLDVVDAVAVLTAADPAALGGEARIDLVRGLERVIGMLAGIQQQAIAAVADATVDLGLTEADARHEIGAALRLAPSTAGDRTAVAIALRDQFPATLAALCAGQVSWRQAANLVDGVAGLPPQVAAAVEARVLDRMGDQTAAETRRAVRDAVARVDPAAAEDRLRAGHRDRRVERVDQPDGTRAWWFPMTPDVEHDMWTTLTHRAKARPDTDPDGTGLSLDARRVDALVDAILRGHPTPAPPTGHAEPAGHGEPAGHDEPAGNIEPARNIEPAGHGEPARNIEPARHIAPAGNGGPAGNIVLAGNGESAHPAGAERITSGDELRSAADPGEPDGNPGEPDDDPGEPDDDPGEPDDDPGEPDRDAGTDPLLRAAVAAVLRGELSAAPVAAPGPGQPGYVPRCSCGGKQVAAVVVDLDTALALADNPGVIPGHGTVPARLARAMAADRDWVRWTRDPGTRHLLDRGADTYRPSEQMKAYIVARDRSCGFPGCHRPAQDCDCDHVINHTEPDGKTITVNLGPLCRQHHNAKTHGRWQLAYDPIAQLKTWTSPLGKTYTRGTDPPLL